MIIDINMINLEEAKILYRTGTSLADLGRKFGVSRQRMHQVLANYKSFGIQNRKWNMRQKILNPCELCLNKAVNLHHRDYNNRNDNLDNLQPLCKPCHYKVHTNKYRGRWTKNYSACRICGTTTIRYAGKGLCENCYGRKNKIIYEWNLKYPHCQTCKTTTNPHFSLGLCKKCYYSRSEWKEKHAITMRKWYLKNRENY